MGLAAMAAADIAAGGGVRPWTCLLADIAAGGDVRRWTGLLALALADIAAAVFAAGNSLLAMADIAAADIAAGGGVRPWTCLLALADVAAADIAAGLLLLLAWRRSPRRISPSRVMAVVFFYFFSFFRFCGCSVEAS